ncbi:hypothetical protein C8J57DRAFT_1259081 [Mycena rebaudengoi]|nr:hypothetical protein C8J57DRAFT_1259081 [Mycena rebaudengoi]
MARSSTKRNQAGSKQKAGKNAKVSTAMIAGGNDGNSPPPPPDPNSTREPDRHAAHVEMDPSSLTSLPSSANRSALAAGTSMGPTEPSVFLKPQMSRESTLPRMMSPMVGISGSIVSTDFTPLPTSISRRATVEEVINEDDHEQLDRLSQQPTGSARSTEPLLVDVHVSPVSGPIRSPQVPPGGYESILGGRMAPSPYDLDGILGPASSLPASSPPESERQRKHSGKQRASKTDSSAEEEQRLRDTLGLGMESMDSTDEDQRPNGWDERARQAAAEAISRERDTGGLGDVACHHREALARTERQLRTHRVEEDAVVAEEIMLKELAEAEDRQYAEKLAQLEIEVFRYSKIPDQGIAWKDNIPYEITPARTRGSSLASRQRHEGERAAKTATPTLTPTIGADIVGAVKRGVSESQAAAEQWVREFYSRPETTAAAPQHSQVAGPAVIEPRIGGPANDAGPPPSGKGSSGSDSSDESSSESSGTYRAERNYSRRGDSTDSAFEDQKVQKREKRKAKKKEARRRKTEGSNMSVHSEKVPKDTKPRISLPPGMTPDLFGQIGWIQQGGAWKTYTIS